MEEPRALGHWARCCVSTDLATGQSTRVPRPVLGEVDPDLRGAYSLLPNAGLPSASTPTPHRQPEVPGEADGPVDAGRVGELDMAEERAAALALVLGQAFSATSPHSSCYIEAERCGLSSSD